MLWGDLQRIGKTKSNFKGQGGVSLTCNRGSANSTSARNYSR